MPICWGGWVPGDLCRSSDECERLNLMGALVWGWAYCPQKAKSLLLLLPVSWLVLSQQLRVGLSHAEVLGHKRASSH